MNYIIKEMIEQFDDYINNSQKVLREVLQKVLLYSLYKTKLNSCLAFIGGTCLRIFYNIDRFSQDLDFVLTNKIDKSDLQQSLNQMQKILESFGLNSKYSIKQKSKISNTIIVFFKFDLQSLYKTYFKEQNWKVTKGHEIKIEFDIDTTLYQNAKYESHIDLFPQYFKTNTFNFETLFASKIAAILLRQWNARGFKGRDLYDYLFYIKHKTKLNCNFLKEKLIKSSFKIEDEFDINYIKKILIQKFQTIDFSQAKNDVISFTNNIDSLDCWSKEFFIEITNKYLK